MRFHQAYYGATARGHDLLACDAAQRERFLKILDRTDLQGALPAGVTVESYITAFRAEDDFVFMRTSPDHSASRGGMMFSHVFLSHVESIGDLHSFAPLVAALKSERPQEMDTSDFVCCDEGIFDPSSPLTSNTLANALLAKRDKPSIWPDTGDFLAAVDRLWQTSWPELRMHLTFSMALSPENAHSQDYAVLYVPEAQVFRWTGFAIIAKDDSSAALVPGAVALTEGRTASSLREVAMQVRWPLMKLSDLGDLATLQAQLDRNDLNPREEIRSLRLLCYLTPSLSVAPTLKSRVVARVRKALPMATLEDLLACRNLRLDCISEQEVFWACLKDCLEGLFGPRFNRAASGSYLEFLDKAEKELSVPWRATVEEGLSSAFRSNLPERSHDIMGWICTSSRLAELLFALIPQTEAAESTLEAALPRKLPEVTATWILSALAPRNMPHLRAKCLAMYLPAERAFDWELSTTVSISALSSLCRLYPCDVILAQAIRTSDLRLIPMAKEALEGDPSLLMRLDLEIPGWRLLLKDLRGTKLRVTRGDNFDRLQKQMFAIIGSDEQDDELITTLGSIGLFDLSERATEPAIWASLPARMLHDFIHASIAGTVLRLSRNEFSFQQLAPVLRAHLSDRAIAMRAISDLESGNHVQQVRLFAVLTSVTEEDFGRWYTSLMRSNRHLPPPVVRAIGELIIEREWRSEAEHIVNDYLNHRRSDLSPALLSITPLLGTWSRFRLMFAGNVVSPQDFAVDDLWGQLESVLVERFPTGPREHGLWSRSKGEDGDLMTSGSGREQWHHALRLIRQDRQGAPSLETLLTEARSLHYNDTYISWFYKNWRQLQPRAKGW